MMRTTSPALTLAAWIAFATVRARGAQPTDLAASMVDRDQGTNSGNPNAIGECQIR
jgi:translation initiation factor IF-2